MTLEGNGRTDRRIMFELKNLQVIEAPKTIVENSHRYQHPEADAYKRTLNSDLNGQLAIL